MNWTDTKLDKVKLAGVTIRSTVVNDNVRQIVLSDEAGNIVMLRPGASYSENILVAVPTPPKKINKYRLNGDVGALHVDETFDTEKEANFRMSELRSSLGEDLVSTIQVAPVEVLEQQAAAPTAVQTSDIPF